MTPDITPIRLNLVKDQRLEIDWKDGRQSVYPIAYLRSLCPCAQCKTVREGEAEIPGKKKSLLTILPGNYAKPITSVGAELVGNYALRIDWSDDHGSGIYSFRYLRDISPMAQDVPDPY